MKKVICRGLLGAVLTTLTTFGIAGISAASPSNPARTSNPAPMSNPAPISMPEQLSPEPVGASCSKLGQSCAHGKQCCGTLICARIGNICIAI